MLGYTGKGTWSQIVIICETRRIFLYPEKKMLASWFDGEVCFKPF